MRALLRFLPVLALLCSPLIPALQAQSDPASGPQPKLPTLILNAGSAVATAELASTPEQLQRGLMFRQKMGDNEGMLFVLGKIGTARFWMMNTSLPLSVAYITTDGRILEIHDMEPFNRETITSTSDQVAFALEMNQGWFALNKITPGMHLLPLGTTWTELNHKRATP